MYKCIDRQTGGTCGSLATYESRFFSLSLSACFIASALFTRQLSLSMPTDTCSTRVVSSPFLLLLLLLLLPPLFTLSLTHCVLLHSQLRAFASEYGQSKSKSELNLSLCFCSLCKNAACVIFGRIVCSGRYSQSTLGPLSFSLNLTQLPRLQFTQRERREEKNSKQQFVYLSPHASLSLPLPLSLFSSLSSTAIEQVA